MSSGSDNPMTRPYVSRMEYFIEQCRDKDVLHVGCSSGRFLRDHVARNSHLHGIIAPVAASLYGVDIDQGSIEEMRRLGYGNLYVGDAEALDTLDFGKRFDVVLAGDLLEHITRPGALLDGAKALLTDNGRLILSTNNAFGLHYQIKRWLGRYAEHFEHVGFFSPETLNHMFARHDYRVADMRGAYTRPPRRLREKMKFFIGHPLFNAFPVLAGTIVVVGEPVRGDG